MRISGRGLFLHLSENGRFKTGATAFVESQKLEKYYNELQQRKPDVILPSIERTPWNTLQLELKDPDGNLLRFNEEL